MVTCDMIQQYATASQIFFCLSLYSFVENIKGSNYYYCCLCIKLKISSLLASVCTEQRALYYIHPPADIRHLSTVYTFPISESYDSNLNYHSLLLYSCCCLFHSLAQLYSTSIYIVGMAFEITVHALLLEVISESRLSFTV
jgi:hypothetical protein